MKNELIEIRKKLGKLLFNFSEVIDSNGLVIIYDGELIENTPVYTYDENGEKVALVNGEYVIETKIIVVVDGVITEVKDVETEKPDDEPVDEKIDEEFSKKFNDLEKKLNNMIEIVTTLTNEVEKFSKTPEDDSIEKTTKTLNDGKSEKSITSQYFKKI